MTLTEKIRDKARQLGFEQVGFSPAGPLARAAFFTRWLGLGFAGQMDYLARTLDKRTAPNRLMPGARTAICLGMNYFQESSPYPDPLGGRIACYARGDDYHDLIQHRLLTLWNWLQEITGGQAHGQGYTDTAPILERELAQQAGLGWQGKNTCLINQRQGSFFFLGEILLDLDLDLDQPVPERCGTCTRCLEACPTAALAAPHLLDARRCISYLTIELKGPIPRSLRPGMGNWIFGCDLCQQACPWNHRAVPSSEPAFQTRSGLEAPSLLHLLAMDQRAFTEQFRRSPVRRAKRRGLLRNVAVALGNSGSDRAVPALIKALGEEEPLVRGHAAWALGRLGGKQARAALNIQMGREQDTYVQSELRHALELL